MSTKDRKARKKSGEKYTPKPAKVPTGGYRTKAEERLAKRHFRTTLDTMIRNAAAKLREEGGA